jgi:hypothetical protein
MWSDTLEARPGQSCRWLVVDTRMDSAGAGEGGHAVAGVTVETVPGPAGQNWPETEPQLAIRERLYQDLKGHPDLPK